MHPAYSIIWFTTLSGAGYGLAAFLGLGLVEMKGLTAFFAYGIASALIGIGLISSTLHLGHPERAWRAFSQWRSSWLSREGVLAVATFIPLSICAIAAIFLERQLPFVGFAITVFAAFTVFATSMIYASLKTIHHWHSWLTSACYLGFATSSGFLVLVAISAPLLEADNVLGIAIFLVLLAWAFKGIWWYRADTMTSSSTPQTALGLPDERHVRRLELPHTGSNYLMKEMGYWVARKHGQKLRMIALAIGLALPILCLLMAATLTGIVAQAVAGLAAIAHFAGIVVERWLFFAQARHAVMLYYGADAA